MGEYYPRIGRGTPWPYTATVHHAAIASAEKQLALLCEDLDSIFSVIEPAPAQGDAYGHRIRNLLLLACTEFEAQCVGILSANNASPIGRHFNTNDYVKLKDAMYLNQYELQLVRFPNWPRLSPFQGWTASSPTQSLTWYDAYNQTKHDRETHFPAATLSQTINAVAACVCIVNAQVATDYLQTFPNAQFKIEAGPVLAKDELYDHSHPMSEVMYQF